MNPATATTTGQHTQHTQLRHLLLPHSSCYCRPCCLLLPATATCYCLLLPQVNTPSYATYPGCVTCSVPSLMTATACYCHPLLPATATGQHTQLRHLPGVRHLQRAVPAGGCCLGGGGQNERGRKHGGGGCRCGGASFNVVGGAVGTGWGLVSFIVVGL